MSADSPAELIAWHRVQPPLASLLAEVSRSTGVPIRELRGVRRKEHQVQARRRFINAASQAGYGCWSIGRALARDHTTILHHMGRLSTKSSLSPRNYHANGPRVSCDSDQVKA